MPRTPQVQRTIKTILTTVLCLDIKKQTSFEKTVRIPKATNETDRAIMNAAQQAINNENVKVLHILKSETETISCTMTEQAYINNATIISIKKENEKWKNSTYSMKNIKTELEEAFNKSINAGTALFKVHSPKGLNKL